MRSRRAGFALLAVAALAAAALGAVVPARAAGTVPSIVTLTGPASAPPPTLGGSTTVFVTVTGDSQHDPPTGTVDVQVDGKSICPSTQACTLSPTQPDSNGNHVSRSQDMPLALSKDPHRIVTTYKDGDATYKPAPPYIVNMATATLAAPQGQSRSGQLVPYTFTLNVAQGTTEPPKGKVSFSDDLGDSPNTAPPFNGYTATWNVDLPPGHRVIFATYNNPDGGGDTFQAPVEAPAIGHDIVNPATQSTVPTGTSTTRRTTATTRRPGSVTTAQLSPVNPSGSTTTTVAGETTVTFSSFQPGSTVPGSLAASGTAKKKQGPPLVVVVLTLLALGVLGAIAAIRRYRRSAIDWV